MSEESVICPSYEPPVSRHIHDLGCRLGIPVNGTFELTSRCNFSCPMCYIHSGENAPDKISAEQWISLAGEAKKSGLMFLLLTGGEPFIRKDFVEIYTAIVKMGILVSINTNASLYSDEIRDAFRKYPPMRVNVSLYGGSKECYANMCKNAVFDKVKENIIKMKEDGLSMRLNVSITPSNCSDTEKISSISKELQLYAKATTYMYPPVRISSSVGENEGRFPADEAGRQLAYWYSIHESAETFSSRARIMAAPNEEKPYTDMSRCRAGRCSFWITSEGKMLPCGTMNAESSDPFESGFDTAWRQIRENTAKIRMPKKCTVCPNRSFCGVCASICKDETGDFSTVPEYACEFCESLKNEVLRLERERINACP